MKQSAASPAEELIAALDAMTVHGGRRSPAPHKPIMVLWAVHRRLAGQRPRLFSYSEAHEPIARLLELAYRRPRPWYPFVRLRSEPFWEFRGDPPLNTAGDVRSKSDLDDPSIRGGFAPKYDAVLFNAASAEKVASFIGERWLTPAVNQAVVNHLRKSG